MYWLAEICVRRPVFALMIVLAMVVAGIVAFPQLGVDRFPNIDQPTVTVSASYPGAASQEMETEVAEVIEDAVSTVSGIEELRSISGDSTAYVMITFGLNRPIDAALQDVRDALAGIANSLPRGMDPPVVQKQDLDSSPIMTLAVSGPRTSNELYFLADRHVKSIIESASGVGQVSISGAASRAIQVEIDARRLAAHRLSILQVREAIVRQNAEVPGGRVDEGLRERSLRTLGRVEKSREFSDLVVATVGETTVRLGDLGEVRDATKEVRSFSRLNRKPAVVLSVQRQSGENTVDVITAVKKRLERSRSLLPDDVVVTVLQDQSRYILAALHEIEGHLLSGSVLASLTVLLFMKSWRSTLIAAVAIPASIIATFAVMHALGFTLNNVTMLALVLMVGVVIDDAIVVLENVYHCMEEGGMDAQTASIYGTREIGLAVLATTLSLVIVFLPVSFLSSVTGRMLYQFGITATTAILVSMIVSFTLTPMMCSRLLRVQGGDSASPISRQGFYHWIEQAYMICLRWSLRFRFVVVAICIAVIAANGWLYTLVSQDYIPTNVDESEFEVRLTGREGASVKSMEHVVGLVEQQLADIRGVEVMLVTGGQGGVGSVNGARMYLRLQDIATRSFSLARLWHGITRGDPMSAWRDNFTQRQVMTEVRRRLGSIPDLRISVRNQTSMRQGAPVDIDFSVMGPDAEQLAQISEQIRQKAQEIPGVVDVDTTLRLDKPELRVSIDRERAAAVGVDVQEIADTLRVAVGGDDRVSRYRDTVADDAYDVELRLVGVDRRDVESISQLYVRSQSGPPNENASSAVSTPTTASLTRLDNVVRFDFGDSQSRIDRLDRQRMVAIRANLAGGYALGDRIAALQKAVDTMGLPEGFSTRVMGRGRELDRTLKDFSWTFALSFVFMYIVLAAQFEHLLHPLTILFSLPLAVPFGLISLYWGGETLNLYSALGILVLFGVVKKAAILQIDHTNVLRSRGMDRHNAILQANRDRLRPILMTTISFVAGLVPLLIATGPGAEERRSIAVLVVGGQTLSLLLTLVAVPVIYSYLDDLANCWLRRRCSEAKPGGLRPLESSS